MSKKTSNKILLIGWDAADWQIIYPLLAKGEMPALQSLIKKGVYGNMNTMNPPFSPMLWSSVATGKTPDKHGVLGFIELMPNLKGIRPVTAHSRKSKAIWNILHHEGYKSNVVGWWPSFPAEPINGCMVTDKFQKTKKTKEGLAAITKGVLHPEELKNEMKDLRLFPEEITEAHILPFIPKASSIDQENDRGLISFSKMISENVSLHSASTNLLRKTEWDFMAIYYDLIDHFCHAYMKFHPPKLKRVPQNLFDIYKDNVVGAYRFQDMMLGRTLELIDDDTTVIVMSDHGYESGHKRILKMPKYPAAPSLEHRQFGIFVAAGPNIKKNEKIFGLNLVDIAPTILHMYNLPVGKDMDGRVALDIFENQKKPKYINSWEEVEGDFGQHNNNNNEGIDQFTDQETMQQLVDLGYIERPDEKIETAILKTKCDLKHNLARVYIGKKEFNKAKEILLELIEAKPPVDTVPFYMDLLTVNLKLKLFNEADLTLIKLKSLDKKFEISTHIAESRILLANGKDKKALNVLLKASKKQPSSLLWYEIGNIYMNSGNLERAKFTFFNALSIEQDIPRVHQALAETLLRLDDLEEAVDHALISIELNKFFYAAHYTLGRALEKLGDLENAKTAFETASRLAPETYHRAEKAIENIEKISSAKDIEFQYDENQIVIVSGLPRSGTSLMMQMLNEGGMDVLTDNKRQSDISNPKGYYEFKPVMAIHKDNTWLKEAQNKSVKVVAPLLKFLDPKYRYKVIFMNRDLTEIIKSQQKMIGRDTENLPITLFEAFKKQLKNVETWNDKEPGVEILYVDYKEVLDNSEAIIAKVKNFVGVELNSAEMLKPIDKSLYRNKV